MSKRGKVLRDPHVGPGLLMVEGQQYPFFLEGVWKSDVPAKPGLAVDVEFDQAGKILGITAVQESQLAKEQAEAALAVAREKGLVLASRMVVKFGMPSLVATALLIISWFFLTAVSIRTPLGGFDFTFWQVLGFINSRNVFETLPNGFNGPSPGFYGFLAIAAIASPFIHYFWKDKRAALGGLVPLLFMLVVCLMARSSMQNAFASVNGADSFGPTAQQLRDEAVKAMTLGFGIYVSILVSLYLAAKGAKQFLAAKGSEQREEQPSHRAAA